MVGETAKNLKILLKRLSFCGALSWSTVLLGYEISLLGFIDDAANSIAVVQGPEDEYGDSKTAVLRVGQSFNHYRLVKVCRGGAEFEDVAGLQFYLKPGGFNFSLPEIGASPGVLLYDDRVEVSRETFDYVRGDGLLKLMYEAASEPYFEDDQIMGFRLFDIEPGSLYEDAGIENYDIITEIDGIKLTSVVNALYALNYLRTLDAVDFYVTYRRYGEECQRRVIVK